MVKTIENSFIGLTNHTKVADSLKELLAEVKLTLVKEQTEQLGFTIAQHIHGKLVVDIPHTYDFADVVFTQYSREEIFARAVSNTVKNIQWQGEGIRFESEDTTIPVHGYLLSSEDPYFTTLALHVDFMKQFDGEYGCIFKIPTRTKMICVPIKQSLSKDQFMDYLLSCSYLSAKYFSWNKELGLYPDLFYYHEGEYSHLYASLRGGDSSFTVPPLFN